MQVGLWFPDDTERCVEMPAVPRAGDVVVWMAGEDADRVCLTVEAVEWTVLGPDDVAPSVLLRPAGDAGGSHAAAVVPAVA
ncbi:hypothetical protein ACIQOW_08495 [Kitasatospora sp. NPDC091335]|uniref:hypothetical protein n=1 Tax=Kitasatospora sp. NPDC091335 TaxID=3364085 RepID=UPI0037F38473